MEALGVATSCLHLPFSHRFFRARSTPPYGLPLFRPITEKHFISPLSIFFGMHHAASTHASMLDWTKAVFSLHNLQAIVVEIAVIVPFVVFGKSHRQDSPSR
jgi:hypothetical protein